ncbi:hypothetical protein, partial [Rhizobium leguminosarum]|uniref:hypothetical protein n=1 Tax=Rhizobium leguminosarum TaxID=384 RepID=UPI003F9584E5
NKKLNWGDIQFRADSTFHIQGDSSTKNSSTPGWHVGDELVGTWELSNNNLLTLWIEPKEHKIFLMYVIIKLSRNQLVL